MFNIGYSQSISDFLKALGSRLFRMTRAWCATPMTVDSFHWVRALKEGEFRFKAHKKPQRQRIIFLAFLQNETT